MRFIIAYLNVAFTKQILPIKMKNKKILLTVIISSGLTVLLLWIFNNNSFPQQEVDPSPENIVELMGNQTSFGVKGNCGMCKKTIETAALSLDGVFSAEWNGKTKQISIVYDPQVVELLNIHKSIANSGYGTELVEYNMDNYSELPLCCQYDPSMIIKSN